MDSKNKLLGLTYIEENIEPKYASKLKSALKSHIRYVLKTWTHKYTVQMLAKDVKSGRVSNFMGVGKVSVEQLKKSLKEDGFI